MGLGNAALRQWWWTLGIILVGISTSCDGSTTHGLAMRDTVQEGAGSYAVSAAQAYAALAAAPGQPGTDYDPRVLFVDYGQAAPPPLSGVLQVHKSVAAGLPNACLRRNKQYEPVTDAIAQRYGLTIDTQVYYGDVNIASFSVPAASDPAGVLYQLRSEFSAYIVGAIFSPLRHLCYTPNDPDYTTGASGVLWDRWQISCGEGWDYTMGNPSLIIAVTDTGVRRTHEELSAQVIDPAVEFPDAYCDVQNHDKDPSDDFGHGTFIAGMIASAADDSRTLIGVAPHCRILPIKIGDGSGAQIADEIAGCILAMDLGARVVNLSFGSAQYVPAEQNMVNQLAAGEVFLAAAAGNDNVTTNSYPAAFTNACAVGATDPSDKRSSFSNYGSYVDIAAPGQQLKSTGWTSDTAYEYNGSGTSFSCPLVAAAAGLVWSYTPSLSLADLRTAIETHGDPTTGFSTPILRLNLSAVLATLIPPVIPTASGITVGPDGLYGAVPLATTIDVALLDPVDVVRAQYTLDLPPYNDHSASDVVAESTTGPDFAATLDVPTTGNYIAELRAEYFSNTDNPGTPIAVSEYLFSQRGDVNADGVVDMQDFDSYSLLLGVVQGTAGYIPFFDSDLDGIITEADASAVGYFFNGATPVPEVQSVTPQEGYTNQDLTIAAAVTGHEPMNYAWDFGGGAIPNTSTELAPAIKLAAQGTYNATLTLSNPYGIDTYQFTLTVGPRPAPTASFTATPSRGQPPLDVSFDASASTAPGGTIANYQWSWDGDTTWEYSSPNPTATNSFTELGDYTVRLRVTDDIGGTGEMTKVIHVTAQPPFSAWTEYDLGLWGRTSNTDNLRLTTAVIDSKPALLWTSDTAQRTRSLHLALSKVAAPTALSDWDMYTLITDSNVRSTMGLMQNGANAAMAYNLNGDITYGEHDGTSFNGYVIGTAANSFRFLCLALIGGKPALFFACALEGETAEAMHYAYAATAHPASAADWTIVALSTSDPLLSNIGRYNVQLLEVNGLPFAQGQGSAGGATQRVCVCASSVTPGADDWTVYGLGDDESGFASFYGGILQPGAVPQLLYNSLGASGYSISYAIGQTAQPAQAADWQAYEIYSGTVWRALDSILITGSPVFVTQGDSGGTQSELWLADIPNPAAASDWSEYELPDAVDANNRRMINHGGGPALLAVIDGGGTNNWRLVYRFPTP